MSQETRINEIYISDRLREQLLRISDYPITEIIAPTGYGKTTAIKWWNEYQKRNIENTTMYYMCVIDNNFEEFWSDFSELIKDDYPIVAEEMMKIGFPKDGRSFLLFNKLWERKMFGSKMELFFIFDDVQILEIDSFRKLLMFLSENMPSYLHFVLLSRDNVFSSAQDIKLGRSLLKISRETFQLTKEEILNYAKCCGLSLSEEEIEQVSLHSDGWFSFIYLIFCKYAVSKTLEFNTIDISHLINDVMIHPLSQEEQKFLTILSVAPKFTEEEASYLWGKQNAFQLLEKLSGKNAFITYDNKGIYRFHSLLRMNTNKMFEKLPLEERNVILVRLADWYLMKKEYILAMCSYHKAMAWEKLLIAMITDNGSSLSGNHTSIVSEWLENCPKKLLNQYPDALLIFALHYFTAGDIPRMLELNQRLLDVVENNELLSCEQRSNFMGESKILLGFLEFNDISAMSRYHRMAHKLMNRNSVLVDCRSPWAFGSPSVLMLYHRDSGALDHENVEMQECMPYYYELTNYHGNGAEYVMLAESYFMRGDLKKAEISYYQASRASVQKKQYNIFVAAELIAIRIAFMNGEFHKIKEGFSNIDRCIEENKQVILSPTRDICVALMVSLLKKNELVPKWILDVDAEQNFMPVVGPVFVVARNEVLLSIGEYTNIISREKDMIADCEHSSMVLCLIYVKIQLACAYSMLGRQDDAFLQLKEALELSVSDKIYMPFVEHEDYIQKPMNKIKKEGLYLSEVCEIVKLAQKFTESKNKMIEHCFGVEIEDYGLSKREYEIALLASNRKTTKEISEILFVSENTIKVHLKHIYAKLGIMGSARNKRELLKDILETGGRSDENSSLT